MGKAKLMISHSVRDWNSQILPLGGAWLNDMFFSSSLLIFSLSPCGAISVVSTPLILKPQGEDDFSLGTVIFFCVAV